MVHASLVRGVALAVTVVTLGACSTDGGSAGSSSPALETLSPSPVESIDDSLVAFSNELAQALENRDSDFFAEAAGYSEIECVQPVGACEGLPAGARVTGIHVGVMQSAGFVADEALMRSFMGEYLTNLSDSDDEYGDASPRLYALGTLKESFHPIAGATYLMITRISGPRPSAPVVPGPAITRQVLLVGALPSDSRLRNR